MELSPTRIDIHVTKPPKKKSPVRNNPQNTYDDDMGRDNDELEKFNDSDNSDLDSLDVPLSKKKSMVQVADDELDDQDKIIQIIESKNIEIQNLHVLLESLKPIPGMDISRLKRQMEANGNDPDDLDLRDAKILELAKKYRSINVSWQKERLRAEKAEEDLETVLQKYSELQSRGGREESVQQPVIPIQPTTDSSSSSSDNRSENELRQQLVEMRRKWLLTKTELKRAQKLLVDELGPTNTSKTDARNEDTNTTPPPVDSSETSTIESYGALSGGWKGRAQQILLLKTRIRELEEDANKTGSTGSSLPLHHHPNEKQVDVKAKRILNEMESERRRVMEEITQDNQQLRCTLEDMSMKYDAGKSRTVSLENQVGRLKTHVQTILTKNDDDDKYIEELKEEIRRLKVLSSSVVDGVDRRENDGEMKLALARLKATNSTQASEMGRMQEIIVDLRSQLLMAGSKAFVA